MALVHGCGQAGNALIPFPHAVLRPGLPCYPACPISAPAPPVALLLLSVGSMLTCVCPASPPLPGPACSTTPTCGPASRVGLFPRRSLPRGRPASRERRAARRPAAGRPTRCRRAPWQPAEHAAGGGCCSAPHSLTRSAWSQQPELRATNACLHPRWPLSRPAGPVLLWVASVPTERSPSSSKPAPRWVPLRLQA